MILIAHGAKSDAASGTFIDLNMLNLERVEEYLEHRPDKLVDLEVALAGGGDALTIDDATRAGAAMAAAARRSGHDVTLFVNPCNVEEGKPYYLHLLTLLISRCDRFSYGGKLSYTVTVDEKRRARKATKSILLDIPLDADKLGLVLNLFEQNGLEYRGLPLHLQTLTVDDLRDLAACGVRLENHGWEHPHYRALSAEQRRSQILDGKEWLKSFDRSFGDYFAAPFGDHVPGPELKFAGRCWFGVAETGRPVATSSFVERVPLRLSRQGSSETSCLNPPSRA
jgi:hypothetical protein